MDSLTHIVLGAGIGELLAGRQLGKKAMLIGAIAQSLPDIDFIASFWMDTSRDLWMHRGITHSLLFVVCMAPLLSIAAGRLYSKRLTIWKWSFFFGIELLVHIFLDAFNAYGTGWFEPFNHSRVSFHTIFVIDPLYTIWPCLSFVALLIMKKDNPGRRSLARWGLLLSSFYLCFCLINKARIDMLVRTELQKQQIAYDRYFTTPTPLNSLLWYVVAEDKDGFHIAYHSVLDRYRTIRFDYFQQNDSLLDPFRKKDDVQHLLRFSQGYYTVDSLGNELEFNDLRFGLIRGWEKGQRRFVLHYVLGNPADNMMIIQRGRLAGWNGRTVRSFIRRIRGN